MHGIPFINGEQTMILNNQSGTPCSRTSYESRSDPRYLRSRSWHTGQDLKRRLHRCESDTGYVFPTERNTVFTVDVDTNLLTGDLDQDIAILSVVA